MDGSPSAIITLGLGTGSFAPEVGLILTLGFGAGEASIVVEPTLFACLPFNKGHGTLPQNFGHLAMPENRGHLTIPDQL